MDAGQERGLQIANNFKIVKNRIGWKVPSQSGVGSYIVNMDNDTPFFTCPDFEKRQQPCKHIHAVEFIQKRETDPNGVTIETRIMRITYNQDWTHYNEAQTHEQEQFVRLLRELCDGIPQPMQTFGRPKLPLSDVVFGLAYKTSAIEPKRRKGNTYGNSSSVDIPLENAVHLPEVEAVSPPITWEQYQQIQERRRKNQELAKRNAKRDFLLRGMIFCESHRGKSGKPRLYTGWMSGNSWTYACSVGGCVHPYLKGPGIEEWAKLSTWCLMNLQPEEFYEKIANNICNNYTQESIAQELKDLEFKYNRNINADTELEDRNLLGQEHPEVYQRLKVQFQTQRAWITEQKEALNLELAQLAYHAPAIAMLSEIRERFSHRLQSELSREEWREIFMALNLEVHIRDRNHPETFTEAEQQEVSKYPEMDIRWGITPKPEALSDIMFREAGPIYTCTTIYRNEFSY